MSFHTPHGSARYRLPWSWSAFDYRTLCRLLWEQCDARFEIAKVEGRVAGGVRHRPRRARARRWSWTRWAGGGCSARRGYQPPEAPLSRGLEVHPDGGGTDLDVWIDRSLVRRGYCWSVPAEGEQRVGAGLVRAAPPRARSPPWSWPAGWACRPCATRATGSPTASAPRAAGRRLLRRRLRRALLPALGRGHPHRVLLRHRLRARAARRAGGRAHARGGAAPLRGVQRRPRHARSGCALRAPAPDPGATAARADAGAAGVRARRRSSTARSAGTWTRPTRRSRERRRVRRRRARRGVARRALGAQPLLAVGAHVLDQRKQRAALLGERVLDPRRDLGEGVALHDALLLERAQAQREGARRDARPASARARRSGSGRRPGRGSRGSSTCRR